MLNTQNANQLVNKAIGLNPGLANKYLKKAYKLFKQDGQHLDAKLTGELIEQNLQRLNR
jgi:hypothetical protein